jgi:hypothetical protein
MTHARAGSEHSTDWARLTDLDLANMLATADDPSPLLAELDRRDAHREPYTVHIAWFAPEHRPQRRSLPRQRAKDSYEEYLESQYAKALEDCAGVLLSKEGIAAARAGRPQLEREIFTGPWSQAERYASEELRAWWLEHGRQTRTSWRYHVSHDQKARRAAELVNLRGHGRR